MILTLSGVTKQFNNKVVLSGISFTVKQGDVISCIGPSGGGKSTLLRCIAGLERIDGGTITIKRKKDTSVPATGMVFQAFQLFPSMTVLENVRLAPIVVAKMDTVSATNIADAVLTKVGLFEKRNCYPSELSGGQQQRVAIARALAMKPEIMLFDEPTSALDPELTGEVLETIKVLAKDQMTILIASHAMDFVRTISDTVLFLDQGVIVERGTPNKIFKTGNNKRLDAFLKQLTAAV